jgi:hypothetical protein
LSCRTMRALYRAASTPAICRSIAAVASSAG